jgi:YihY family inner membrane protein
VSRFFAADGLFLAAGLAFFFLVCMLPLLLLAVATVGFVLSTEQAAHEVVGQLSRNFPVYSGEINRALLRIVRTRTASGVLGTVILVLFSMPLFGAVRLVLHRMLGIRGGRSFLRNLVVDAGMVLLLASLLFVVTVATWGMHWFQDFAPGPLQVPGPWSHRVTMGLSLALSALMFYLGYRYVPYRQTRMGAALAGAMLASVLWEAAKQLFQLYIRQVGVYDQIYGPFGVLVAFVMFVYYSAVVFVLGAAYVAALDAREPRRGASPPFRRSSRA